MKKTLGKLSRPLPKPDGMHVKALVAPRVHELLTPKSKHDEIKVVPLKSKTIKYGCGHGGPEKFNIDFFGDCMKPNFKGKEKLRECPTCRLMDLKKLTIRCAACRLSILPGEGVAIYLNDEHFDQTIAHKIQEGDVVRVLGCLRMDCCPTGGYFAGHWTEQGFKPAFDEGRSAASEAFTTGKVVISNV